MAFRWSFACCDCPDRRSERALEDVWTTAQHAIIKFVLVSASFWRCLVAYFTHLSISLRSNRHSSRGNAPSHTYNAGWFNNRATKTYNLPPSLHSINVMHKKCFFMNHTADHPSTKLPLPSVTAPPSLLPHPQHKKCIVGANPVN